MLTLVAALALGAELYVQPGSAHPGDAVAIFVRGAATAPQGTLGDRELTFLPAPDGRFLALTGLPLEQKKGPLAISVVFSTPDGKERLDGSIEILPANFPRREITIAKRYVQPSKRERAWSLADQRAFTEAMSLDFEAWTFAGSFTLPRTRDITAPFGDRRTINGKLQSQHYGTDLDGSTGDPIYAANDGEAVMVRECFGSGNTVLLHHGGRLFTSYFHMSAFEVKAGQKVKRGALLGRVGKTGRVTGPHLHFGAKIDGHWIDPMSLLALDLGPPVAAAAAAADAGAASEPPAVSDAGPAASADR